MGGGGGERRQRHRGGMRLPSGPSSDVSFAGHSCYVRCVCMCCVPMAGAGEG